MRGRVAAAFAGLALLAPASAEAAEYGVNAGRALADEPQVAAIASTGVTGVRADAVWGLAEPGAPRLLFGRSYDWSHADAVAGALARYGLRWQPVIAYSALWASSDRESQHAPPRKLDDLVAYAEELVRRYGPDGEFWRDNAGLPAKHVTRWEVWNEPNHAAFWRPRPDPEAYAEMYARVRSAIRGLDPKAQVIVGGLSGVAAAARFAEQMYEARPSLRGEVDGVGHHPYGPTAEYVLDAVTVLRRKLASLGEGAVPIHVTEIGWAARGRGKLGVPTLADPGRAASLALVAEALGRSDCGVGSVVPYAWLTEERDEEDAEQWMTLRGTPAGDAFAGAVARAASARAPAPLPVCSGSSQPAALLPLEVAIESARLERRRARRGRTRRVTCAAVRVGYAGHPLPGATVRFVPARGPAVRTDSSGLARACRPGSLRRVRVRASVDDAAAGEAERRRR